MILQEAILHIPLSQYAFANSERNLTIRIRVAKDNLTDCVYGSVHEEDTVGYAF